MNFGAILYNGEIYTDLREDPTNAVIKMRKSENPDYKIEGNIFKAYADKRFAYNYYIFSELEGGTINQKVLRVNDLNDLTGFDFKPTSNIVYIVDETFDDPLLI